MAAGREGKKDAGGRWVVGGVGAQVMEFLMEFLYW
jgi:hypothetical protein